MKKKKSKKKTSFISKTAMTVLTIILIILFFCIMSMVEKIQGTARVVNYAGLVRGKTQRIIKLEDAGEPQDTMIADINAYIDGLQNGSSELDLVRLDDRDFQDKMTELASYFEELKAEILLVREKGYENTAIIEKSETFFKICDEATGLAEAYSQRMASSLKKLEQVVVGDIIGLVFVIGMELIKAVRYAAMNRILQKKVYLDEATGLPNKNKCEEILEGSDGGEEISGVYAVCVFDLNNLRTINNSLGHDKGDEYIRSFAVQLRKAVPEEYFVGRNGGDEFLAILRGLNREEVEACMNHIRTQTAEYSRQHPEMPISYAGGYALSTEFEDCDIRELFRHADQNMYIDKNRAKMEEAAAERKISLEALDVVKKKGYHFSNCIYCNARQDQYRILRAVSGFFLAEDGSYTGAAEHIVQGITDEEKRKEMRRMLDLTHLKECYQKGEESVEILYEYQEGSEGEALCRGKVTILFYDAAEDGGLHHFLMGFERFRSNEEAARNEKEQLDQYYEQMKQSIIENSHYAEALLETAEAVFAVDLTNDSLEQIFYHSEQKKFDLNIDLPCSYEKYCGECSAFVAEETLESYRIVDSSKKLLQRFENGDKQVVVEYQEADESGRRIWLQKTVLMSQDTVYDRKTKRESVVVHGMILFRDTSEFHSREEREKIQLQDAFRAADSASRAKTEFMNRMSHDVRTPINGIMGMLDIIRKNRQDEAKVDDCLDKINLSASHLLALVNDVLDMNKLESGKETIESVSFDLTHLMDDVASLVNAQITEMGITHRTHRGELTHTRLIGSPLRLRQIMLNLFSNAIKYNKPGGTIDTYAGEVSCDGTRVVYEFRITDSGIGMSSEFIEKELFHPFTQEKSGARTQYKGTGLGMSIVKELIEKMQGTIEVTSQQGVGTTYVFRLPFYIDCEGQRIQEVKTRIAGKELVRFHVLLVEDNEINMEIAEFYLTDHGATVEEAWNGREAVEKYAANPQKFDVILMDLMMPVMGGLEAARQIRAMELSEAKQVPIIPMTAQSSEESKEGCRAAGMNSHLTKPIEPDSLVQTILETTEHAFGK